MNINKINNDIYYYTDILNYEEQEIIEKTIKDDNDWKRVYDSGQEYDPNRDPDAPSSQSVMVAYRKFFNLLEHLDFIQVIDKAFKITTQHYKKNLGIEGKDMPSFDQFAHVDKHMRGTTYSPHVDTAPIGSQSYTVLFYLNDDYSGGELSFNSKEQGPKGTYPPDHIKNSEFVDYWIKPKKLSIVIFPPLKPYIHTAHEVKEGIKYLIKGFWLVKNSETNKLSTEINPDAFQFGGK